LLVSLSYKPLKELAAKVPEFLEMYYRAVA